MSIFDIIDRDLAFRLLDGEDDLTLHPKVFDALYEHYLERGMPYGIAKGRDGDPYEYVLDRLEQDTILHSFDVV